MTACADRFVQCQSRSPQQRQQTGCTPRSAEAFVTPTRELLASSSSHASPRVCRSPACRASFHSASLPCSRGAFASSSLPRRLAALASSPPSFLAARSSASSGSPPSCTPSKAGVSTPSLCPASSASPSQAETRSMQAAVEAARRADWARAFRHFSRAFQSLSASLSDEDAHVAHLLSPSSPPPRPSSSPGDAEPARHRTARLCSETENLSSRVRRFVRLTNVLFVLLTSARSSNAPLRRSEAPAAADLASTLLGTFPSPASPPRVWHTPSACAASCALSALSTEASASRPSAAHPDSHPRGGDCDQSEIGFDKCMKEDERELNSRACSLEPGAREGDLHGQREGQAGAGRADEDEEAEEIIKVLLAEAACDSIPVSPPLLVALRLYADLRHLQRRLHALWRKRQRWKDMQMGVSPLEHGVSRCVGRAESDLKDEWVVESERETASEPGNGESPYPKEAAQKAGGGKDASAACEEGVSGPCDSGAASSGVHISPAPGNRGDHEPSNESHGVAPDEKQTATACRGGESTTASPPRLAFHPHAEKLLHLAAPEGTPAPLRSEAEAAAASPRAPATSPAAFGRLPQFSPSSAFPVTACVTTALLAALARECETCVKNKNRHVAAELGACRDRPWLLPLAAALWRNARRAHAALLAFAASHGERARDAEATRGGLGDASGRGEGDGDDPGGGGCSVAGSGEGLERSAAQADRALPAAGTQRAAAPPGREVPRDQAEQTSHPKTVLDVPVCNALMNLLGKCRSRGTLFEGPSSAALNILREMEEELGMRPDLQSFHTVMDTFAKEGDVQSVSRLFDVLLARGLQPNTRTFSIRFHAAAQNGDVAGAREVYADMRAWKVEPNEFVHTTLIHLCTKSGFHRSALRLFQKMAADGKVKPTVASWAALLDACCQAAGEGGGDNPPHESSRSRTSASAAKRAALPRLRSSPYAQATLSRSEARPLGVVEAAAETESAREVGSDAGLSRRFPDEAGETRDAGNREGDEKLSAFRAVPWLPKAVEAMAASGLFPNERACNILLYGLLRHPRPVVHFDAALAVCRFMKEAGFAVNQLTFTSLISVLQKRRQTYDVLAEGRPIGLASGAPSSAVRAAPPSSAPSEKALGSAASEETPPRGGSESPLLHTSARFPLQASSTASVSAFLRHASHCPVEPAVRRLLQKFLFACSRIETLYSRISASLPSLAALPFTPSVSSPSSRLSAPAADARSVSGGGAEASGKPDEPAAQGRRASESQRGEETTGTGSEDGRAAAQEEREGDSRSTHTADAQGSKRKDSAPPWLVDRLHSNEPRLQARTTDSTEAETGTEAEAAWRRGAAPSLAAASKTLSAIRSLSFKLLHGTPPLLPALEKPRESPEASLSSLFSASAASRGSLGVSPLMAAAVEAATARARSISYVVTLLRSSAPLRVCASPPSRRLPAAAPSVSSASPSASSPLLSPSAPASPGFGVLSRRLQGALDAVERLANTRTAEALRLCEICTGAASGAVAPAARKRRELRPREVLQQAEARPLDARRLEARRRSSRGAGRLVGDAEEDATRALFDGAGEDGATTDGDARQRESAKADSTEESFRKSGTGALPGLRAGRALRSHAREARSNPERLMPRPCQQRIPADLPAPPLLSSFSLAPVVPRGEGAENSDADSRESSGDGLRRAGRRGEQVFPQRGPRRERGGERHALETLFKAADDALRAEATPFPLSPFGESGSALLARAPASPRQASAAESGGNKDGDDAGEQKAQREDDAGEQKAQGEDGAGEQKAQGEDGAGEQKAQGEDGAGEQKAQGEDAATEHGRREEAIGAARGEREGKEKAARDSERSQSARVIVVSPQEALRRAKLQEAFALFKALVATRTAIVDAARPLSRSVQERGEGAAGRGRKRSETHGEECGEGAGSEAASEDGHEGEGRGSESLRPAEAAPSRRNSTAREDANCQGTGESGRETAFLVPDIAAFNALLNSCAQAGHLSLALAVFTAMQRCRVPPDLLTYTILIKACGMAGEVDAAERVFEALKQKAAAQRLSSDASATGFPASLSSQPPSSQPPSSQPPSSPAPRESAGGLSEFTFYQIMRANYRAGRLKRVWELWNELREAAASAANAGVSALGRGSWGSTGLRVTRLTLGWMLSICIENRLPREALELCEQAQAFGVRLSSRMHQALRGLLAASVRHCLSLPPSPSVASA
ncbi:hypothetical protein BESB_000280 [Besnoitia besnoiti]|uniref:PROP1-like PPR domain-containing protein n=1 Tax=Besnoitia besnoiti TaxID=94643 RepID=A0A2A9MNB1_BESBE|nr:hypothetical protein BESB_000280 [Besnoitia besnoiti]PFH37686.1 hypothetical protein BESB_000280 [Besnoitia besnoiti]